MNTELTEIDYNCIKSVIYDYGLNVAFLVLYDLERSERYNDCFLLNEGMKRFCKEINIKYKIEPEEHILECYKSKMMQNNLPIYKMNFRTVFARIKGYKIHLDLQNEYKQLKK